MTLNGAIGRNTVTQSKNKLSNYPAQFKVEQDHVPVEESITSIGTYKKFQDIEDALRRGLSLLFFGLVFTCWRVIENDGKSWSSSHQLGTKIPIYQRGSLLEKTNNDMIRSHDIDTFFDLLEKAGAIGGTKGPTKIVGSNRSLSCNFKGNCGKRKPADFEECIGKSL